jgi:hypothetical protein
VALLFAELTSHEGGLRLSSEMVAQLFRKVVGTDGKQQDREALVLAFRRQITRSLAEGRWRFADHFCDALLAESPRDLETWLVKGHLAWRRFHEAGKAVSCFRKVVMLGGYESSNACVARAQACLRQLLEQLS